LCQSRLPADTDISEAIRLLREIGKMLSALIAKLKTVR
jgi:hypothetical protein